MLSLRKRTQRELATFTTAPMQNRYALHRSGLSSSANLFSDTYLDPNTKAEADTDTDIEPVDTGEDTSLVLEHESDAELDSEAEEILNDIARFKTEGPAKPNHTDLQRSYGGEKVVSGRGENHCACMLSVSTVT
jgi:hypothetical protein